MSDCQQIKTMQYQDEPNPATDFKPDMRRALATYEFNNATYALGCVAPYVFRHDTYVDEEGKLAHDWVLVGEADLIDDDGELMIHDVYFYENTEEYSIQLKMIEEQDEYEDEQFEM